MNTYLNPYTFEPPTFPLSAPPNGPVVSLKLGIAKQYAVRYGAENAQKLVGEVSAMVIDVVLNAFHKRWLTTEMIADSVLAITGVASIDSIKLNGDTKVIPIVLKVRPKRIEITEVRLLS